MKHNTYFRQCGMLRPSALTTIARSPTVNEGDDLLGSLT